MKTEEADPDINNIVGTNKVTQSGRVFSPEISPKTVSNPVVIPSVFPATTPILTPVVIPADESFGTRGKEVVGEPARTEAPRKIVLASSKQEMEEILKITKKSDSNVVE